METQVPWEGVALSWGLFVSWLISLLKRAGMPSRYVPYLTWLIGGAGMLLASVTKGVDPLRAALDAAIALVSAPGFYELISKPLRERLAGESQPSS